MRRWWRRWRARRADTGEVCRTCLVDLSARDCWEWVEHLPNTHEMEQGGTYMTGYWCTKHRPEGAWRWAP